ncbi:hypothetical protein [Flavobacterium sp.]|uniref:hypothetical protein n=1 Tax=Flavobacterium sp. TaxID=239 RepID=UPI002FD8D75E
MQKIVAFLNKYAIPFNIASIAFWSYIIYTAYTDMAANDNFDKKKYFFILPAVFILLSCFNLYMAVRRKKSN